MAANWGHTICGLICEQLEIPIHGSIAGTVFAHCNAMKRWNGASKRKFLKRFEASSWKAPEQRP